LAGKRTVMLDSAVWATCAVQRNMGFVNRVEVGLQTTEQ
jgi:hypothetical protein